MGDEKSEPATAVVDRSKTVNALPEVITVDTASAPTSATEVPTAVDTSDATPTKSDSASQARTPKHANKHSSSSRKSYRHGDNETGDHTHHESSSGAYAESLTLTPPVKSSRHHQRDWVGGWINPNVGPPPPPPTGYPTAGSPFEPPSYHHASSTQGGAFLPHDRQYAQRQHMTGGPMPPMQVSPGGGRYYYSTVSYDPRYASADFAQAPNYPQPRVAPYSGGHVYSHHGYPPSYDQGRPPQPSSSWGPPPSFPHGRPMPPSSHHHVQHHADMSHQPQSQGFETGMSAGSGNPAGRLHESSRHNAQFSRAVSNSFDRSTKSSGAHDSKGSVTSTMEHATDEPQSSSQQPLQSMHYHSHAQAPPPQDGGSFSEDASWGALQQVHSVDEEEMRKRLLQHKTRNRGKEDVIVNEQPASNSSSLTNSPTDGVEGKEKELQLAARKRTKPTSSLDSLSSVASVQEPMDTTKTEHRHSSRHGKQEGEAHRNASPDGSAPSYDLIKCPSGSSALLLPSHQRSLSQLSLGLESKGTFSTKPMLQGAADDEERDGKEDERHGDGTRGGGVVKSELNDGPAAKKSRSNGDEKKSPLSITCSPPSSPSGGDRNKTNDPPVHQPQAIYPPQQHRRHHARSGKNDSSPAVFYDKAPCYTYSMESSSSPQMPREVRRDSYPPEPRPGSSNSSSTITPMNVDGGGTGNVGVDMRHAPPGVGQMPSWEIHAQDSFGTASAGGGVGGNPLMGSFSFQQDYQMLGPSTSTDAGPMQLHPPMGPHGGMHPNQTIESRDQSFEGGHYHGGFARTDSMMSYEGRQMSFDGHGRSAYQGPFPPHAASWGSAGSYPAGYMHPSHRMSGPYPPMMRNYSEDSGARASPPPSSGMHMMPPSNFPPPPEFRAPPSMVNKGGGPQNTILTSSYSNSPKAGPFGWSKDEDSRLTEIMKKFKNPRDWGPITKEHNRGRSAKECHERWIRYLKPGVRKGQWTDHEDAVVMEVVSTSTEQPFTRWSDLAQRLPGRVGKQIRDRWVNHLNPAINHLPFSREDDLNLWEGHTQLGKRWVEIATKHFNNSRSENHIKNRWYSASFKKFISNEFGANAYNGGKASSNDSVDGVNTTSKDSSPNKKKISKRQSNDPSPVEAV